MADCQAEETRFSTWYPILSNFIRRSTDSSFVVTAPDPVTHSVTVEAPGFKKTVVDEAKVDTASVENLVIKMVAGRFSSEVTITAEASAVNTESGTTSSTMDERQIPDVPLFNRSVLRLAVTQPNVNADAGGTNELNGTAVWYNRNPVSAAFEPNWRRDFPAQELINPTPRLLSRDEKRCTVRIDHPLTHTQRLTIPYSSTPISLTVHRGCPTLDARVPADRTPDS